MHEDPNITYDNIRCRICGRRERGFVDLDTGEFDPPHPDGEMCSGGNPKLRGAGDTFDPLPSLIPSPNFDSLRERRRAWVERGEIEREERAKRIRAEIEAAVSPARTVARSGYIRVVGTDPVAMEGFDVVPGSFVPAAESESPFAGQRPRLTGPSNLPASNDDGVIARRELAGSEAPTREWMTPLAVLRIGHVELAPRFVGYPDRGEKGTAP